MLEPLVTKLNKLRIVLASTSKQRKILLGSTKLNFEIYGSDFKEDLDPGLHTFSDYVEKTAIGKLNDVYEKLKNDKRKPDIIIAVDTMVAFNGKMYGKPSNKAEAFKTIKDLTQSKIPNLVYSGVAIRYKDKVNQFTEVTTVHMMHLTDEEILSYVESGEPMGKAGGYGIQGIASSFVERIEGDCNNVIGLPLCRLTKVLKELVCEE